MVERASINAQLRPSSRSNPPRLQPTPHSSSSSETSQRPPADRSRRLSDADRSHVLPGEVRHLRQAHVGGVRPPRRVRARADPRGPALRLPRLAGGRPRRRQGGGGGRLRRSGGVFVHLRLHHPVRDAAASVMPKGIVFEVHGFLVCRSVGRSST